MDGGDFWFGISDVRLIFEKMKQPENVVQKENVKIRIK